MNFLGIAGSLRQNSYNHGLLEHIKKLTTNDSSVAIFSIEDIPLYNEDLETNFPKPVQDLKDAIRSADGVVIATPEYNRSIPGVLKNVIDWTSRPHGDNPWDGKPVLVVGASLGAIGTAVAQSHLKQILSYLNAKTLGQPEFYLNNAAEKFNADGFLIDEKTKANLLRTVSAFIKFARGQ